VRHRQVLAVATVALFGLSGCADRPNDLDTYYDDPTPTPTVEPAQPSVKPQAAPVPQTSTPAPVPAAVSAALLTDEDRVETQRAWCDGTTCTVLLAKGKLVSALSVTAGTEARATDAAKRLLPIVAQRLRSA